MLRTVLAKTSVQVEEETRDKLKAIGRKGESYDAIILRLLKDHEELKGKDRFKPHTA